MSTALGFIIERGVLMEFVVKTFDELTVQELFEIYYYRQEIFVVEQVCPYQDIDQYDQQAYHVWLKDEDGVQAYLRVIGPNVKFKEASIGRVISRKRRCGLATMLLEKGIEVAKEKYNAKTIRIEAQVYARGLYEKVGFKQISEEFLLDDQPHITMLWLDE